MKELSQHQLDAFSKPNWAYKNGVERSRNQTFCRVEPRLHHEMTQFQPLLPTFTLSRLRTRDPLSDRKLPTQFYKMFG